MPFCIDNLETALETGSFAPVFVPYKDDWELQMTHASPQEQEDELELASTPEQRREFWLGHVIGWRGITRRGQEVPFDRDLLRKLWRLDGELRLLILRSCQSIDTFRRKPGAAAAPGARASE